MIAAPLPHGSEVSCLVGWSEVREVAGRTSAPTVLTASSTEAGASGIAHREVHEHKQQLCELYGGTFVIGGGCSGPALRTGAGDSLS